MAFLRHNYGRYPQAGLYSDYSGSSDWQHWSQADKEAAIRAAQRGLRGTSPLRGRLRSSSRLRRGLSPSRFDQSPDRAAGGWRPSTNYGSLDADRYQEEYGRHGWQQSLRTAPTRTDDYSRGVMPVYSSYGAEVGRDDYFELPQSWDFYPRHEREEARRFLAAADRGSRDGRITRYELDRLLQSGSYESQRFRDLARWLKVNFRWWDKNQSGALSFSELQDAIGAFLGEGHEASLQSEIRSMRQYGQWGYADPQVDRMAAQIMISADQRCRDGRISRSELEDLLRSRTYENSRFRGFLQYLRANFRWFDANHSGGISMTELRQAVASYLRGGQWRSVVGNFDEYRRTEAQFDKTEIDKLTAQIMLAADQISKDGELTINEVQALIDSNTLDTVRFRGFLQWLKDNFKWMDRDASGTISQAELRDAVSQYLGEDQLQFEIRAFGGLRTGSRFTGYRADPQVDRLAAQIMMDVDRRSHNGRISRRELERLMYSSRFEDQRFRGFAAWLRANFNWFDSDHSGQISIPELRQAVVDYLVQGHVPGEGGIVDVGTSVNRGVGVVDTGMGVVPMGIASPVGMGMNSMTAMDMMGANADVATRLQGDHRDLQMTLASQKEMFEMKERPKEIELCLKEVNWLAKEIPMIRYQSRSLRLEVVWAEKAAEWSKERARKLQPRVEKWSMDVAELRRKLLEQLPAEATELRKQCFQKKQLLQDAEDEFEKYDWQYKEAEALVDRARRSEKAFDEEKDALEGKLNGPQIEVRLERATPIVHSIVRQLEKTQEAEERTGIFLRELGKAARMVRTQIEGFAGACAEAQRWIFPPDLRQVLDDPRCWGWDLSEALAEWLSQHLRRVESREREFLLQQNTVQKVLTGIEDELHRLQIVMGKRLMDVGWEDLDCSEVAKIVGDCRSQAEAAFKDHREAAKQKRMYCIEHEQKLSDATANITVLRRQLQTTENRAHEVVRNVTSRRPGPPGLAAASEARSELIEDERATAEAMELIRGRARAVNQIQTLEEDLAEQQYEVQLLQAVLSSMEFPTGTEEAFTEKAMPNARTFSSSFRGATIVPISQRENIPLHGDQLLMPLAGEQVSLIDSEEVDDFLTIHLQQRLEELLKDPDKITVSDWERFKKDREDFYECENHVRKYQEQVEEETENQRTRLASFHGERARAEAQIRAARSECNQLSAELEQLGVDHKSEEKEMLRCECALDEVTGEQREAERAAHDVQKLLDDIRRRQEETEKEQRLALKNLEETRDRFIQKEEEHRLNQVCVDEFAKTLEVAAGDLDALRISKDCLMEGVESARDRLEGIAKVLQAAGESLADAEAWEPNCRFKLSALGLADMTQKGLSRTPCITNGGRISAKVPNKEWWASLQEVLSDNLIVQKPFEFENVRLMTGCKLLPLGPLKGCTTKKGLFTVNHDWGPDEDSDPMWLTFEGPAASLNSLTQGPNDPRADVANWPAPKYRDKWGELTTWPNGTPNVNVAGQVQRLEAVAKAMGEAASGVTNNKLKHLLARLEGIAQVKSESHLKEIEAAHEQLKALELDVIECTRAVSERAKSWGQVNQVTNDAHQLSWKLSDAQMEAWGLERKLAAAKAQVQRVQLTRERREEHRRRQAIEFSVLDKDRQNAEHRCELLREEVGVAAGEARTLQAWLRHSGTDDEKNFGGVSIPQWVLTAKNASSAKDVTLANDLSMATQLAASSPQRLRRAPSHTAFAPHRG